MEKKILKILLYIYILFCLIIAGLNFGVAPGADEQTAKLILAIWHFYENQYKTLMIIAASWLSFRVLGKKAKLQRRNMICLISAALAVHIIGPLLISNHDLYFYAMPFPWSSTGLQTAVEESSFRISHLDMWGLKGITASLIFYIVVTVVVYAGTLINGRRWQCSSLCLFNGFIAETFSPAFRFPGKKEWKGRSFLLIFRWVFLIVSLAFVLYWFFVFLTEKFSPSFAALLVQIETFKYLILELLMAMFFWIAFTGRGYCYYCPLGTVLSWVSRAAGQRIRTNLSKCISCGNCDKSCPMGIDISSKALTGSDVTDPLCVGCGHCIDSCPTGTLKYTTKILDIFVGRSSDGKEKSY